MGGSGHELSCAGKGAYEALEMVMKSVTGVNRYFSGASGDLGAIR